TSTPATGLRAARRSARKRMGASSSSAGSMSSRRGGVHAKPGLRKPCRSLDAHSHRDGRMAPAGERGRADLRTRNSRAARARRRAAGAGPAGIPHPSRPTYPEIRLAVPGFRRVAQRFQAFRPEAVHIATEGPIGWMARRYCRARRLPFTTSFHTRFPEYLAQRFALPAAWTTAILRRFHNAGNGLMVATPSLSRELEANGFERVLPWTRGVDTALFHARPVRVFGDGPIFLYVGRIATEKNITAFLDLNLP